MKYITLADEPSINITWLKRLEELDIDHLIIMTKNPSAFVYSSIEKVIENYKDKIQIWCTITGYGKSNIEPNVPIYQVSLMSMKYLIDKGYDVVLNIDPIFPTNRGFDIVNNIIYDCIVTYKIINNLKIHYGFIKKIDNEDKRKLKYSWRKDFDDLPTKTNKEKNYININEIKNYLNTLKAHNCEFISDSELDNRKELMLGLSLNTQCEMNCRYCYYDDRIL